MSGRDRSRERSPPGKGNVPKKTKESSGDDEDTPVPRASGSRDPPAGGSAPPATRTSRKHGKQASPRSSSKRSRSRGASPLARLGQRVRSLFGLGGSATPSPRKSGESSSARSSQSSSSKGSKGSKPFIGPLLPEGYVPYTREELDSYAEYYRKNSFLNRTETVTEYIPFGPGAAVTIPWTTPPIRFKPIYSTAPSTAASSAGPSPAKAASTSSSPAPLMSAPTLPYSLALGPQAQYPEFTSPLQSFRKPGKTTEEPHPHKSAIAASQSKAEPESKAVPQPKAASPPKECAELTELAALAIIMAASRPQAARTSSGAEASKPAPLATMDLEQPDDAMPSCSGLQRTVFRDDSSSSVSTSDISPDVPPRFVQPPFRPPKPPSPTDETEEERLKRPRRKGEPRK
ncbi:hypothetical protein HPB50_004321 [Hyalomma asiaticum]|uniref:Uncharacterized protein n=1 Tax=Hyalomma asiaticum TaxID=266040 RepID=A0ACB7RQB9_HYAAI|nr:hypothetical protein HPB50_004321 [Hyalomma asiaticum]